MTVLIANANKSIFTDFNSKIKFYFSTENTSTFNITEKKFIELRDYVRSLGYNPYAVMYW